MFVINGERNFAKIMLPDESYLDDETKKQIYNFLTNPALAKSHISVMPDCHAGIGAVVGFTMTLRDYVIPNMVGVDIGCGILATPLEGIKTIDFDALDKNIHRIPSGFHKWPMDTVGDKPYVRNMGILDDFFGVKLKEVSDKVGASYKDVVASLGTLGGGNHFIEIDTDSNGKYWLIIHSGSRNLGLKIANYHQNKAKKLMNEMFIGDAYKTMEFLPLNNGGEEYLKDMAIAQLYAVLNRRGVAKSITRYFFSLEEATGYECIHNYIDMANRVVRKGAISAFKDEQVVIPLNMRDGIIVGKGKGNKEWNNSAPHGAGRNFSRKKAKETFNMDEFKKSMEGIYTTCVTANTLDESPMAYKDKELILDSIKDTVEISEILKPIYNFKAGGE